MHHGVLFVWTQTSSACNNLAPTLIVQLFFAGIVCFYLLQKQFVTDQTCLRVLVAGNFCRPLIHGNKRSKGICDFRATAEKDAHRCRLVHLLVYVHVCEASCHVCVYNNIYFFKYNNNYLFQYRHYYYIHVSFVKDEHECMTIVVVSFSQTTTLYCIFPIFYYFLQHDCRLVGTLFHCT
jgi:hypothetical protein